MQRLMSTRYSRTLLKNSNIHQLKRFNSTTNNTSINDLLNDCKLYFKENSTITKRIDTIKPIIPNLDTDTFEPNTITLGINQSKELKPGLFVDALTADPLSNDHTYPDILRSYRKSHPNSNLKVIFDNNKNESIGGGIFKCKSPIFNSETRLIQDAKLGDGTSKLLNRDFFNNLSFVEVNDSTFSQHIKLEGAETLDLNSNPKDNQIKESDIQLWVNILSSDGKVTKINDIPYLNIINTKIEDSSLDIGTSIKESLPEDSFEVDLDKINSANSMIMNDINNVSEYLKLYQKSNINELLFTINRETSGYKPLILLLRGLLKELHLDSSSDIKTAVQLKDEIKEWSQHAHFELQSKVTPFLENVLLKDFTKITQLIYNSGDLTLVISNLLNGTRAKVKTSLFGEEIECYGTLNEASSKSHYLEGRIDTLFPESIQIKEQTKENVNDYLSNLQGKIANEKLPEVQSKINKYIINEIIAAPFTIFILSNIGYIYDLITLNSAFAFTALTLAVTLNTSHKKIISIITEFKDWYIEQLRLYIDNTTIFLGNRLNEHIKTFEETQIKKTEIIESLKNVINELEKRDKLMK